MRRYSDEALVEGRPVLAVTDEDAEAISEMIAEALLAALERDQIAEARSA